MKLSKVSERSKDIAYKAAAIPYFSIQPTERLELIKAKDWQGLALHDATAKLWIIGLGLLFLAPIYIFMP